MIPGIGVLVAVFGSSSTLGDGLQFYYPFNNTSYIDFASVINNSQSPIGWSWEVDRITTSVKNGLAAVRLGSELYGSSAYISTNESMTTKTFSFFTKIINYGEIFNRRVLLYDYETESYGAFNDFRIYSAMGGDSIPRIYMYVGMSGSGNLTLSVNNWYHFVVNYNSATGLYRVHVNNSFICEGHTNTPYYSNIDRIENFWGAVLDEYNNASGPQQQHLDEIGIWNRILTTNEISELYNSGNGKFYPF